MRLGVIGEKANIKNYYFKTDKFEGEVSACQTVRDFEEMKALPE